MMESKMIRTIVILCVIMGTCCSCGPRMYEQISVKPFHNQMPPMPKGTVPTTGRMQTYITQQSKLKQNPLKISPTTIDDGRIYYRYYCLQCHGVKGDGNGPVGQSYIPKPLDLSTDKIANMTDGKLYNAMLHGVGHDPVMSQTVPANQRWQLVAYVRTYAKPNINITPDQSHQQQHRNPQR